MTEIERADGHFHGIRFYDTKDSLCRTVAEFLGEGLVTKQPALVIVTPEHRAGIVAELRARHFDVDEMEASGDVLLIDAREILQTFMVGAMPDADLFATAATGAIKRLSRGRKDCTIRAYGEIVDLLWKDGQTAAAIQLERLWNKLAMTRQFSLLCGYAMGSFYKDALMADVCRQHTHVVEENGTVALAARAPTID